ncbi:hypothetical protein HMPREF9294_0640 [Porphyromonas asaccharolytica PR426713P-I]|nr:hypothetical protein HMPREF9294_0640 [Porphyromonas asaccharolytica PR426713P-I]
MYNLNQTALSSNLIISRLKEPEKLKTALYSPSIKGSPQECVTADEHL